MSASPHTLFFFAAAAVAAAVWKRKPITEGALLAADAVGLVEPRGYRNNNPGNLRFLLTNAFNGQTENDKGYAVYSTMALGYRAMGKQLQRYEAKNVKTVEAIINMWAPSSENDSSAYVEDVAARLGLDPTKPFNVTALLPQLAQAIAIHENGFAKHTIEQVTAWVRLS